MADALGKFRACNSVHVRRNLSNTSAGIEHGSILRILPLARILALARILQLLLVLADVR